MNRTDLNRAMHLSLLMPDKRSDSHNVYAIRARQEREVQDTLGYSRGRPRENVSNVVPIRPDLPPAA